jgi:hypothetical protein
VDLLLSGLDPARLYSFATSACRAGTTTDYDDRYTVFTLSGADAAQNASTPGTQEYLGNPLAVWFNTGDNDAEGYSARWSNIAPGPDGSISVRAEAHPDANSGYKAYAFSVFRLEETVPSSQYHALSLGVTGLGSIQRDPDQNYYAHGSDVTLTALPADGWEFVQWTGDLSGSTNPRLLGMDSDKTVGAEFREPVTAIGAPGAPRFVLEPCAPNPVSHVALLRFSVPKTGLVTLRVHDVSGRVVLTLVDGIRGAGAHEVALPTGRLASGVYFARLRFGDQTETRKIALMH